MVFEKLKFTNGLTEIRRSIEIVWRGAPRWTLASLALGLAQAVLPLVGLYLLRRIIDGIVVATGKGSTPSGWQSLSILIACAFLSQLLTALCRALAQTVQEAQASQFTQYSQ